MKLARYKPISLRQRFSHWVLLTSLIRYLTDVEVSFIRAIQAAETGRPHNDPWTAKLNLGMKATAAALATAYVLRKRMRSEAEGPQRTFLESWVFMMFFHWFPGDPAFATWMETDKYWTYLSEREHEFRKKVEPELQKRLGMAGNECFPVRGLFRTLSNTAVHPTRSAAERSFLEAAARHHMDSEFTIVGGAVTANAVLLTLPIYRLLAQVLMYSRFLRIEFAPALATQSLQFSIDSDLEKFCEELLIKHQLRFNVFKWV